MFPAPKSHQNLLCKVFRNEVLKQCHPQHKLTPSRLSCDCLLLCFPGKNGWMLMLVLGKGIKGWSFGPGDSHRFNITGSRNYLFKSPCGLRLFSGPLQQDWTLLPSWTGDCGDAVARGQQNSPSGKGWGKAVSKPHQKICLSPARGALESTEDREMGGINGEAQAVFVVSYISQYSKQFLLTSRIPVILTQKADLWF